MGSLFPWARVIRRTDGLTHCRTNRNLHVRGYKEEGTIATAFDMRVQNNLHRFHLSRLPEVLRHAHAEPMVSGWTHPDRAIRRSVGRSVEVCCERLSKRMTPDFIGAFGRLPRSQKVSLLPSLPSMRVWTQHGLSLD